MIEFYGIDMKPDLTGALYISDYNMLLVADLHFEKGSSCARFGLHIPPFDTSSSLDMLEDAISRYSPCSLVCLGDSFHDDDAQARLGEHDRHRINRIGEQLDILWITGNHDPALSGELPGTIADEAAIGPLVLRHEPLARGRGIICGHLHPAATISQRGRRLRRRCFAASSSHLFMPAFGAYTGALDVKSKAFLPWLADDNFDVWMIGRDNIHRFPASKLV